MPDAVKTRAYRSARRQAQAAATRACVIEAARELFAAKGYAATTVAEVAGRAAVSVDTVYTSVGRKPDLVLAVIDTVLGGSAADQRGYVRAIRAHTSAREKIAVYAAAVADLVPRIAPLQEALRVAGATEPECAEVWQGLVERRAHNMREFAADLRSTGEVRADLEDDEVADLIWSMNSAEYWQLLHQRGWTPRRYERLLTDVWTRTLLTAGT